MQFNVSYAPPAFIRFLRRQRVAPLLQKQPHAGGCGSDADDPVWPSDGGLIRPHAPTLTIPDLFEVNSDSDGNVPAAKIWGADVRRYTPSSQASTRAQRVFQGPAGPAGARIADRAHRSGTVSWCRVCVTSSHRSRHVQRLSCDIRPQNRTQSYRGARKWNRLISLAMQRQSPF